MERKGLGNHTTTFSDRAAVVEPDQVDVVDSALEGLIDEWLERRDGVGAAGAVLKYTSKELGDSLLRRPPASRREPFVALQSMREVESVVDLKLGPVAAFGFGYPWEGRSGSEVDRAQE